MREIEILTAPLSPSEIEWRVQSKTKDGSKVLVLPYVTSREVMKRMDAAFGVFGWKSDIQEITDGFLCTLSIWNTETSQWISKTDGSQRSDIEGLKGGISGAIKRCAVQFGIGRALYDFPTVYIETPEKYIPGWANKWLDSLVEKINAGESVRDMVTIRDATFPVPSTKPKPNPVMTPTPVPDLPLDQETPTDNAADKVRFMKEIDAIALYSDCDRIEIGIYGSKLPKEEKELLFKLSSIKRIGLVGSPPEATVVSKRLVAIKNELGEANFTAVVGDLLAHAEAKGMKSEKGKGFSWVTEPEKK